METVKIYSLPTCNDCNYAKRYFEDHKIAYTEFNCADNGKYAEEVKNLTGEQTVPTIVIDEFVFIGFVSNSTFAP